MENSEPFHLFDCSLVRCGTGRVCFNLRELHDALCTVSEEVLKHHMMRCALEDHFELHEFPNDLARWCWTALGDRLLGEQLGLVDPYRQLPDGNLRDVLVNLTEDRLWGTDRVPWCGQGMELHLTESRLIAYDTEDRITSPAALFDAIERMTTRSLFYHVHEARCRSAGLTDDFSSWLEQSGADAMLVQKLRAIDFYFLNLRQLRDALIEAFQQYTAEAPAIPRESA